LEYRSIPIKDTDLVFYILSKQS